MFFFFKQKTAYELRISDGSSDVCSSDLAVSSAPIAISHTGCRALNDVPRNTTDADLRALADKGGVAGIYFMPFLRASGQPRADDVIRPIAHAVKVAGEAHVALGPAAGISGVDLTRSEARGVEKAGDDECKMWGAAE